MEVLSILFNTGVTPRPFRLLCKQAAALIYRRPTAITVRLPSSRALSRPLPVRLPHPPALAAFHRKLTHIDSIELEAHDVLAFDEVPPGNATPHDAPPLAVYLDSLGAATLSNVRRVTVHPMPDDFTSNTLLRFLRSMPHLTDLIFCGDSLPMPLTALNAALAACPTLRSLTLCQNFGSLHEAGELDVIMGHVTHITRLVALHLPGTALSAFLLKALAEAAPQLQHVCFNNGYDPSPSGSARHARLCIQADSGSSLASLQHLTLYGSDSDVALHLTMLQTLLASVPSGLRVICLPHHASCCTVDAAMHTRRQRRHHTCNIPAAPDEPRCNIHPQQTVSMLSTLVTPSLPAFCPQAPIVATLPDNVPPPGSATMRTNGEAPPAAPAASQLNTNHHPADAQCCVACVERHHSGKTEECCSELSLQLWNCCPAATRCSGAATASQTDAQGSKDAALNRRMSHNNRAPSSPPAKSLTFSPAKGQPLNVSFCLQPSHHTFNPCAAPPSHKTSINKPALIVPPAGSLSVSPSRGQPLSTPLCGKPDMCQKSTTDHTLSASSCKRDNSMHAVSARSGSNAPSLRLSDDTAATDQRNGRRQAPRHPNSTSPADNTAPTPSSRPLSAPCRDKPSRTDSLTTPHTTTPHASCRTLHVSSCKPTAASRPTRLSSGRSSSTGRMAATAFPNMSSKAMAVLQGPSREPQLTPALASRSRSRRSSLVRTLLAGAPGLGATLAALAASVPAGTERDAGEDGLAGEMAGMALPAAWTAGADCEERMPAAGVVRRLPASAERTPVAGAERTPASRAKRTPVAGTDCGVLELKASRGHAAGRPLPVADVKRTAAAGAERMAGASAARVPVMDAGRTPAAAVDRTRVASAAHRARLGAERTPATGADRAVVRSVASAGVNGARSASRSKISASQAACAMPVKAPSLATGLISQGSRELSALLASLPEPQGRAGDVLQAELSQRRSGR